ncbi:hypothetical protein [Neorhizobium sp. LjRoot104]|uniref:hypothetical protein n=1 Tax=Neorhizobium sp. LjRoot104 TaxID=3342254 RepID=UPI003ECC56F2
MNAGYQANVYYDGLRKSPAGVRFSVTHEIGEDWLWDIVKTGHVLVNQFAGCPKRGRIVAEISAEQAALR